MTSTDQAVSWTPPSGLYNATVEMIDGNLAEGRGAKLAVIDPTTKLTYAELAEVSTASPMLSRGLGSSARAASCLSCSTRSSWL